MKKYSNEILTDLIQNQLDLDPNLYPGGTDCLPIGEEATKTRDEFFLMKDTLRTALNYLEAYEPIYGAFRKPNRMTCDFLNKQMISDLDLNTDIGFPKGVTIMAARIMGFPWIFQVKPSPWLVFAMKKRKAA